MAARMIRVTAESMFSEVPFPVECTMCPQKIEGQKGNETPLELF